MAQVKLKFWLIGILLFIAGGVTASPKQSRTGSIIPLEWGYIEVGRNGVSIISTVEDPPEIRLGASKGNSLGKVSFNVPRADGVQEEVAILQGKLDERFRNTHALAGEMTTHIRKPFSDGDAAMILIRTERYDGVTYHVPVYKGWE